MTVPATEGANWLAKLIDQRIRDLASTGDHLELGIIQADMSLKLDRFEPLIPQGEYLLLRSLTLPDPMASTSDGATVPRPAELAPVTAGDRVLVAWINEMTDVVILDVVVSS